MARHTKVAIEEARENLRKFLKPGDKVHCILRHVSRSGMQRTISLLYLKNGEAVDISPRAAIALDGSFDNKRYGIKVGGCGMDMGFEVVYGLSCALFCPDKYDHDSAYGLSRVWL